jgi:hypothetical protein
LSKQLYMRFQLAEARGQIKEGTAAQATFATLAEKGVRAAAEGYYGKAAVAKARSDAKAEQDTLDLADELLQDIAPMSRAMLNSYGMQATHTTSDFPLALSNLRQRELRDAYEGEPSNWRSFASVRTVSDFKAIRALRFTELPELRLRPEGTDVTYTSFSESEEGYRVANYERAVKYTWEMWKNDDVGGFTRMAESLGRGAARTEVLVVLQAIADGLARTALTAGAGAPTIDRLAEMERRLAERTFADSDGGTNTYGFRLTDVIHGTAQRQFINAVLTQQFRTFQGGETNPMNGAFDTHLEPLWSRVLGNDLVAYDRNAEWLEVAFLEGFQGGMKTYVKLPDVTDHVDEGAFADHSLHIKGGHSLGAKVLDSNAAIRTEGAA